MKPALIQLHESDNVGVCTRSVTAGEIIVIFGEPIMLDISLAIGHKLALKPIAEGELIVKYGVPIGTATAHITTGAHVHTHNIKSNYIPTYE